MNGVDLLVTALALIALLTVCLYTAWRRDDRERRMQRLRERGLA